MKRLMITFVFCFIAILTFQNAYSDDWREAIILKLVDLHKDNSELTKIDAKVKYKKQ